MIIIDYPLKKVKNRTFYCDRDCFIREDGSFSDPSFSREIDIYGLADKKRFGLWITGFVSISQGKLNSYMIRFLSNYNCFFHIIPNKNFHHQPVERMFNSKGLVMFFNPLTTDLSRCFVIDKIISHFLPSPTTYKNVSKLKDCHRIFIHNQQLIVNFTTKHHFRTIILINEIDKNNHLIPYPIQIDRGNNHVTVELPNNISTFYYNKIFNSPTDIYEKIHG